MDRVNFKSLADKWPSTIVAREQISAFSGGILNPRTCANWDVLNQGIKGRVRIGRKICYPVKEVISFLESRAEVL